MKLSELMNIPQEHDPSTTVLVAGKPSGYLDFRVVKHYDGAIQPGGIPIIVIEATEEIVAAQK